MRIAQVSPWFHPHVGGVESHVRSVSAELARRGHDVTVLTSNYSKLAPSEEVDGFRIRRVPCRTVALRTPITPALRKEFSPGRFDVVHAHTPPPQSAYYAATGSERARIPFVLTYHCDPEIPNPFGRAIVELYRRTYGVDTMRRAAKVIVTTETYAATSRAIWRYTPEVIPNAVDASRFRPDVNGVPFRERWHTRPDDRVVLFVGRVVPHKGIEHYIEAAKFVPDSTFIVAGDGPYLESAKRLAATFGVQDRVVFPGRIRYRDLPAAYASADVFVLPSVSRLEAFGIVALEAMATAKPVVVTDIPGVREVITDGREGLVADAVNPEDLAAKIRTLLDDVPLRREMGAKGRRKVESEFGIDGVIDRIEAVYREAIGAAAT